MKKKQNALLVNGLIILTALTTVAGAILKLIHHPAGRMTFVIGILSFLLVMALKRILKDMRK